MHIFVARPQWVIRELATPCRIGTEETKLKCDNNGIQTSEESSQDTGSSLVQVMAWHRTGDKPLPGPMLIHCQFNSNKLQWNFNQNAQSFCQDNAFKNVIAKYWSFCSGYHVFKQVICRLFSMCKRDVISSHQQWSSYISFALIHLYKFVLGEIIRLPEDN